MKRRDAIVTGILHLSQNRLRAGLSILGVLIGIASVLCMMAIGDGAKLLIAKDLEKLGGTNQVQLIQLKMSCAKDIAGKMTLSTIGYRRVIFSGLRTRKR